MKSLIKTILSGSIIALLVTKWDIILEVITIQNVFQEDTDLLIKLGGMIGYTSFIIFAFFLQQTQIKDILRVNKGKGLMLYIVFITITISFLSYILMNFNLQIAMINLMIYLIIVSIVDFVSERMMMTLNACKSHAKSIF
ncbi:hypothetical protein KHQ89_04515 [Mycoplasmatota bacterium]|nr:hypothetical protein KHQ89_04515 [Mycoplasmatota bacterium]